VAVSLGRFASWGLAYALCQAPLPVVGQELITDQVSLTVGRGQIFGVTPGEGIARQFLGSGEEIVAMEAKGVTGFVHTTKRLLGFSGRMLRWVEFPLSSAEHIVEWTVTPWMIIVIGKQQGYAFQSELGRWKKESWGAGEVLGNVQVTSHVGLVMTNRRALAFSANTGGFFPQDLSLAGELPSVQMNDHIVILHAAARTFVFRSGLAIWTELP